MNISGAYDEYSVRSWEILRKTILNLSGNSKLGHSFSHFLTYIQNSQPITKLSPTYVNLNLL